MGNAKRMCLLFELSSRCETIADGGVSATTRDFIIRTKGCGAKYVREFEIIIIFH